MTELCRRTNFDDVRVLEKSFDDSCDRLLNDVGFAPCVGEDNDFIDAFDVEEHHSVLDDEVFVKQEPLFIVGRALIKEYFLEGRQILTTELRKLSCKNFQSRFLGRRFGNLSRLAFCFETAGEVDGLDWQLAFRRR